MFATHNAHTISAVLNFAGTFRDFEFQRLYGMGKQLYSLIVDSKNDSLPCRVYAPCGDYKELLPYLVRRLIENGANSSFVNRIIDPSIPPEQVAEDPIQVQHKHTSVTDPKIPLPTNLYLPQRLNSRGIDLTQETILLDLKDQLEVNTQISWNAKSIVNGKQKKGKKFPVFSPADLNKKIGTVIWVKDNEIEVSIEIAKQAFSSWQVTTLDYRTSCLNKAADLIESNSDELIKLCILEAGKTIANAVDEIREAVDYCRYYAQQANNNFSESSFIADSKLEIKYMGCGVFACISPWNFPLAIFLGQVARSVNRR